MIVGLLILINVLHMEMTHLLIVIVVTPEISNNQLKFESVWVVCDYNWCTMYVEGVDSKEKKNINNLSFIQSIQSIQFSSLG
jgi:hypothetical protein